MAQSAIRQMPQEQLESLLERGTHNSREFMTPRIELLFSDFGGKRDYIIFLDHQDKTALVLTFARYASADGAATAHQWANARPPA